MSQVQTTTNNKAESIIALLQTEQVGFRELFKTQKAFDKFTSNFRLMTVKQPEISALIDTQDGKKTLFTSLYQAAHDGLVIDGKRAALVLFNQKSGSQWIKTVQYFPMVLGIREKVFEYTGMLLEAQIVYSNDIFEWEQGDNPKLVHKPSLMIDEAAKPVVVYAVARKDGLVVDRVVMRIAEIEKIMRSSKSGWDKDTQSSKGIWKDHWEEMAKKTAIRRLAKQLPLVDEVQSIIEQVDQDYQQERKNVTPLEDDKPSSFAAALEDTPSDTVQTTISEEPEFEINPDAAAQADLLEK
jgi:recombination protein RecT